MDDRIKREQTTVFVNKKIKISETDGIVSTSDKVLISETTSIDTCRIRPQAGASKITLFYLPGTASHDHFPSVINNLCGHIASNLSAQVIPILYRTSNIHLYPTPLIDIEKVINYYLEHSEQYEIDKQQIFLCGYSAGALLGILLNILNLGLQDSIPFRGLILLGPVTDLSPFEKILFDNHKDAGFIREDFLPNMVSDFIRVGHNESWPVYSPLNNSLEAIKYLPPTLMIYGEYEIFSSSARKFAEKLRCSNCLVIEESLSGKRHDFMWQEENIVHFTSLIMKHLPALLAGPNPKFTPQKMYDINNPELIFFGQYPYQHTPTDQLDRYNDEIDCLFKSTLSDLIVVIPGLDTLPNIASNYFHSQHYQYAYRWYLDASNLDSLSASFKTIAARIMPDSTIHSDIQSVEIIKHWLQYLNNPQKIIIVYDNLSDPLLLDMFYLSNLYHTIIISSHRYWPKEYYIPSLKQYYQTSTDNILENDESRILRSWQEIQNRFSTKEIPNFMIAYYKKSIQIHFQQLLVEIYRNYNVSESILGNRGITLDENCFHLTRDSYSLNELQEENSSIIDYSLVLQYSLDRKNNDMSLNQLLNSTDNCIWLTAMVGMGKTTLLRYLCYLLTKCQEQKTIGIYIPLSLVEHYQIERGNSDKPYLFLITCINHLASKNLTGSPEMIHCATLKYLITCGHFNIHLFFDEYDEFVQQTDNEADPLAKVEKVKLVESLFLMSKQPHIRAIIASSEQPKANSYTLPGHYFNCKISEWEDSQIEYIVSRFFSVPNNADAESKFNIVPFVLKAIHANNALKNLCKIPMMLMLICNIVRSNQQNLSLILHQSENHSDTVIFNFLNQELKLRIAVDNQSAFNQHLASRELFEWRTIGNYADRALAVLQKIALITLCHPSKKIVLEVFELSFAQYMQLSQGELAEILTVLKNYGMIRLCKHEAKEFCIEIAHGWIQQYYAAKEIARCLVENDSIRASYQNIDKSFTHQEFINSYKFHEPFLATWLTVIEILMQYDKKSQFSAINYFWRLFQSAEHDALQVREQYIEFLCLSRMLNNAKLSQLNLFKQRVKSLLELYQNQNTYIFTNPFALALGKMLAKYQALYPEYFQILNKSPLLEAFSDTDIIHYLLKISIISLINFSATNINNLFAALNEICLRQMEYKLAPEIQQITIYTLINLTVDYPDIAVPEKVWAVFETFKHTKKMNRGVAQILIGYLKNCHTKRKICDSILRKIRQDEEIRSIDGQIVRYASTHSLIKYPTNDDLRHFKEHSRDWKTDLECQAILYHFSYQKIRDFDLEIQLINYLFLGLGEENWHHRTAVLNAINHHSIAKPFLTRFLDYIQSVDSIGKLESFFPHYQEAPGELSLILMSLDKIILSATKCHNYELSSELQLVRQERLFNYLSQQLTEPESINRYEDILNCLSENFTLRSLVLQINQESKKQAIYDKIQQKISLFSIHALILELVNQATINEYSYLFTWLFDKAYLEGAAVLARYQSNQFLLLQINQWEPIELSSTSNQSIFSLLCKYSEFVMPFSFWTVENINKHDVLSYYELKFKNPYLMPCLKLEYALLLIFKNEYMQALGLLAGHQFTYDDGCISLNAQQNIFDSNLQQLLDTEATPHIFSLTEMAYYAILSCMQSLNIKSYKDNHMVHYIQKLAAIAPSSILLPLALNSIFDLKPNNLLNFSLFSEDESATTVEKETFSPTPYS